jgi:hypothetical protein
MKTKLLTVALLASAALIAPVQGGGRHGNGGGNYVASGGGAARSGSGPSFRSAPMRNFGSGRTIYSGQRFSSVGVRSPRSMEFRPQYSHSNAVGSIGSNQVVPGNISRGNRSTQFANTGNRAITNLRRDGNGARQARSGNNLPTNWRNHVVAQRSGNWQRNWDRSRDHVWHGHHCRFINGSWVIFDFGFDPWWPYWYDPYYYGYDYYPYSYGYDPGYDSGVYQGEEYYDQNRNADQSGNSTALAAQQVLAQQGYYRGQIDGVFGPETRAAIAEYQSNRGLRVTGTLTPDTLQALGLPRVASY